MDIHLDWLLKKGEDRIPIKVCPVCGVEKVGRFFVRHFSDGILTGPSYIACNKQACVGSIIETERGFVLTWHELKFSSLSRFRKSDERRALAKIFKEAFLHSGKLSRKTAFELFLR